MRLTLRDASGLIGSLRAAYGERLGEYGQMFRKTALVSLVLAVTALVALSACAPPTTANQAQANCAVGTVGGAALGGLLGNQFGGGAGKTAMTVLGATAGGAAGAQVGCQ